MDKQFIIEPYLTFDDNCRQAFDFYKSVFGGEYRMMTYGDVPPDSRHVPEQYNDHVLHVALPVGREVILMGSDTYPGADKITMGNNIDLTLSVDDEQEARRLYRELSEGGQIKMELQKTFFAELYAVILDKFGIYWMIVYGSMK